MNLTTYWVSCKDNEEWYAEYMDSLLVEDDETIDDEEEKEADEDENDTDCDDEW